MITHPSLPQRLVRQLLALSACALGMMASLASAQTFTPGDVFWVTSLPQATPPVNNQVRAVKITGAGSYAAAPAFAVLPDRV